MLDADLAEIYGYTTRRFNEQVKNNIERFDDDFRFQLTKEEFENLMCKKFTSSWGGSSKDGGKRVTSISRVEDVMLYQNIVGNLRNNPSLQL